MTHSILHAAANIAAERMLQSIVIGLALAVFACALLRVLPRPSAATRFAVWFTALAATGFLSALGTTHHIAALPSAISQPLLSVPASWSSYFAIAWAALSVIALLQVAAGWREMRRLRQSCRAIPCGDVQWRELLAAACPSRHVEVVTSDRLHVPTAIGFLKPIVVLPSPLLEQLTPVEINQVLLHELAHLRRWDDWTNAVQKLIKVLLFFHPAVWWMEEQVSLHREMACDDAVVSATASPRAYAECLANLAEKTYTRRSAALVQAAVNRVRQTTLRVARLLNPEHAARPARTSAVVVVAGFACACVGIATQLPPVVSFANESPVVMAQQQIHTTPDATDGASALSLKPILAASRVPVRENRVPGRSAPLARQARQRSAVIVHHPQRAMLAESRSDIQAPFIIAARTNFDLRATFKTGIVIIYVNDPLLGPTPLMFRFAVWEFVPAQSPHDVIQRKI